MAVEYGFYNSLNHDRRYNTVQISKMFDGIIKDGVFMSIGDALDVVPSSNMREILIKPGKAWFNHSWTTNDADYPLSVGGGGGIILSQYAAIVLEINATAESRKNEFKVIYGEEETNPTYPILINTEYVHQYPLAYVLLKPSNNNDVILPSEITKMIGTSSCPYVTGLMETVSIDSLISQWEGEWTNWLSANYTEFSDWFNSMKDQLSTDAAGNLQNQIDSIKNGGTPVGKANTLTTSRNIGNALFDGHVGISLSEIGVPNDNLLDNSNFQKCVNLRRSTSYAAVVGSQTHCISRWKIMSGSMTFDTSGVTIKAAAPSQVYFYQQIDTDSGKTYTFSVKIGSNTYYLTGVPGENPTYNIPGTNYTISMGANFGNVVVNIKTTDTSYGVGYNIAWAKLEEGAIATPYHYKGYGAEMIECMRYYQQYSVTRSATYISGGNSTMCNSFEFPVPMRATPTITFTSATLVNAAAGLASNISASSLSSYGFSPLIGAVYTVRIDTPLQFSFYADAELVGFQ